MSLLSGLIPVTQWHWVLDVFIIRDNISHWQCEMSLLSVRDFVNWVIVVRILLLLFSFARHITIFVKLLLLKSVGFGPGLISVLKILSAWEKKKKKPHSHDKQETGRAEVNRLTHTSRFWPTRPSRPPPQWPVVEKLTEITTVDKVPRLSERFPKIKRPHLRRGYSCRGKVPI